MLQLIYELRKNCCGRVDGWTDRGSIRGPRGPKNMKRVGEFIIIIIPFIRSTSIFMTELLYGSTKGRLLILVFFHLGEHAPRPWP